MAFRERKLFGTFEKRAPSPDSNIIRYLALKPKVFIKTLTMLGLAYFRNVRVRVAALEQQVAKTC